MGGKGRLKNFSFRFQDRLQNYSNKENKKNDQYQRRSQESSTPFTIGANLGSRLALRNKEYGRLLCDLQTSFSTLKCI